MAAFIVLAATGAAAAADWLRPASFALRAVQHTSDATPIIVADIRGGRKPAADDVEIEVDGKIVAAIVRVSQRRASLELPKLRDGRYDVRIQIRNRTPGLGNRTFRSAVIVDTVDPPLKVRLSQKPDPQRGVNVALRISTQPDSRVELTAGGEPVKLSAAAGIASHTITLSEGRHKIDLKATDRAGNVATKQFFVWADATAPSLEMPNALGVLSIARPKLTAKVSDNRPAVDALARATIDGRAASARIATDGSLAVVPDGPLSEGDHELRLTVEDPAGNKTSITRVLKVNSTESLGEATLRQGAMGADVRLLQKELNRPSAWSGSAPQVPVSGTYDLATAKAVERFQSQESLGVDGVAGPFTIAALTLRISIDKSSHRLVLYRYGAVYRTYPIAIGQPKYPTPTGEFRIVDKQKNPTWTPPDSEWARDAKVTAPGPDNPLGTRWMGLDAPSIGIHGTNDPQSLGYSVSHGCIRMSIAHVEELFDIVEEGTRVQISS
ncbi:MAG: ykuD 6 [Thermoleophilia bacterium]|nr:ykuD 6 [Thermoleophilia bacterium]